MRRFFPRPAGRYYLRIMMIFIFLSLTITVIVSGILYSFYTRTATREISRISIEMLSKSNDYSEFIFKSAISFIMQVEYSKDTLNYLNSVTPLDEIDRYLVSDQLGRWKSAQLFLHSVYLYNGNMNEFLSVGGSVPLESQRKVEDRIRKMVQTWDFYSDRYLIIPQVLESGGNSVDINVLTVLYAESNGAGNHNAIAANIHESNFRNQVKTGYSVNGSSIFIISQDGIVLSHTHTDEFMKDCSSFDYIQEIQRAKDKRGTFSYQINGVKSLVTYVKNDVFDYTVIGVSPFEMVNTDFSKVQKQIVILCIAVLIIGILAFIGLSKYVYSPVDRLVNVFSGDHEESKRLKGMNELDFISGVYQETSQKANLLKTENQMILNQLKFEYLRNLLLDKVSGKDIQAWLEKYDISIKLTDVRVFVVKIDHYALIEQEDKAELDLKVFSSMDSYFRGAVNHIALPMWNGEYAVMINCEEQMDDAGMDELVIFLEQLQDRIKNQYNLTVSIGIGNGVKHLADAGGAYRQALELMKYKLVYGTGSILVQQMIEKNITETFVFPEETEKAVLHSIKFNRLADFEAEIEELLRLCSKWHYEHIYYVLVQVAMACIKQINVIYQDNQIKLFTDYNRVVGDFQTMESADEVRKWFMGLFAHYQEKVTEIEDIKRSKNNEMIWKTIDYIKQNYTNPDLSLELISSMVDLSPGYFSKLFKETANMNVSDFIARLRTEKAKELLSRTDLSISEVSVQSGFININYFYNFFKKNIGLTPTKYRIVSNSTSDTPKEE